MNRYILALDQGTTSSRAILFASDGRAVATAQREIRQILPRPGHVEHDANEIWESQLDVARQAIERAGIDSAEIAAIGITNQRETSIVWDRQTGQPIGNAIVWQSRISAGICEELKSAGHEDLFRRRTGLLLDPYFSGTKLKWMLDRDSEIRRRAAAGDVLFGTVDSFLIWRLTNGKSHVTDVSNASRTLMFDITALEWDEDLLRVLDVPRAMMPRVKGSSDDLGTCDRQWFGREIPITGCAGDQQAATFGQGCFDAGSAKNTYGTGCFLLMNVGDKPVPSEHRLISTIGWKIDDRVTYCLEGSIFVAGALIQWLRDGLQIITDAAQIEDLANLVNDSDGVVIVPAFVGLGAPHWDPYARGSIMGLTRNTNNGHLARAALESLAFQTCDLVDAMALDAGQKLSQLKVDGGASVNNLLMQVQSDLLDVSIERPKVVETTALGAAFLAGLRVGIWRDLDEIASCWALDRRFEPDMKEANRRELRDRWNRAVGRTLGWETPT